MLVQFPQLQALPQGTARRLANVAADPKTECLVRALMTYMQQNGYDAYLLSKFVSITRAHRQQLANIVADPQGEAQMHALFGQLSCNGHPDEQIDQFLAGLRGSQFVFTGMPMSD